MKALDIAFRDVRRSFRNAVGVSFMFGVPLLVTGMFYFMFGNIAGGGGFDLPRTKVIVANLDQGGPKFQVNPKNVPGGREAKTMGELVVSILESDEMKDLIELSAARDAASARQAVDTQASQVAIIIPTDFSKQFADLDGKAVIEFYQDPTLTIGPAIMRSILNRFLDSMGGVKIAVNLFLDKADPQDYRFTGEVVDRYIHTSLALEEDPEAKLMQVQPLSGTTRDAAQRSRDVLLGMIGNIMGGMMIFYAFFTGTSTAQSILKEEEERTLPRLFTTPTSQAAILSGKFLSVFMVVSVQIIVLLAAGRFIFGIQWGSFGSVALNALGIIFAASAFGIFLNSFLKSTRQAGVMFGGVLTVTGMLGMISIFAQGSPGAADMGNTVGLLVPQGWAVRGLVQAMNGEPPGLVLLTTGVLLLWSAVFFVVGVWRFNRRYA
ncbi:MAG TPA: ABC transporter permease [Anaerolineales bacterium]